MIVVRVNANLAAKEHPMKTTIPKLRRTIRKVLRESAMSPRENAKYEEGRDQGYYDAKDGHGRDVPPRRRFDSTEDYDAYVAGYNDGFNSY